MSAPEGFLARWSKRKRAVEVPAAAAPATGEDIATEILAEPQAGEARSPTEMPPPTEASEPEAAFDVSTLPAIESLTGASDLTAFMQKGVPEALKNAALRHAWALDPLIRDYRGPVDYAWDFNDPLAMAGFSPEPPAFDAERMLRGIVGEPPVSREKPAAETASDVPDGMEVSAAPDAHFIGSPGAPTNPESKGGEGPESQPVTPADHAASGSWIVAEEQETVQKNFPRSGGRRHGGALPD